MRTKILALGLFLIYLSGFISAQLSESDVVYVIPGEKIYHIEGCKNLGIYRTGMALSLAKKKGYTACPVCLPEKKEPLQKIEKKLETPLKVDIIKAGPPHDRSRLLSVKIKITNTSKKHTKKCVLSCILYDGDKEIDFQTEHVISSVLGGTGLNPNRFTFFEYIFSPDPNGWNKIDFHIEEIDYK
ncbi:hypothetical protein ES703_121432 [subsurface metagenome]